MYENRRHVSCSIDDKFDSIYSRDSWLCPCPSRIEIACNFSPPPYPNSDDYSSAATLITFQRSLPLLRGPIKAGPLDDPSSGPYLLAFRSRHAWAAAYVNTKSQILSQCESGARIGCSISASSKCRPPWWKILLGMEQDLNERAKCEEIEMEGCFKAAKGRCGVIAKEKCGPAFKNARIRVSNGLGLRSVDSEVFGLISRVCFGDKKGYGIGDWGIHKSWGEFRRIFEVTNIMGSDLLDPEMGLEDYLKENS